MTQSKSWSLTLPWVFGVPGFVALLVASSCAKDAEDCSASQSCISDSGASGEAGSDDGTGGSSATGGSTGKGGSGASAGRGGSSGRGGGGGVSGTAQGGADPGGSDAGGSDAGGSGGTGGDDPEPDTTPPSVLSVSPAHGATGVTSDQNIVITFSEPMDAAATEGAYQSGDLPLNAATASWSSDGRVLTLDPTGSLAYATGTDPTATTARTYAFSLSAGALDRAGNQLAQAFNWSFRTSRRITHTLRPVADTAATTEYWAYHRVESIPVGGAKCPTNMRLGTWAAPYRYVGTVAFQIAPLPAGVADFESATLSASQINGVGNPFALTGSVLAFHIPPVPVNQGVPPHEMPIATTPLHNLGAFSANTTVGPRSLDVLASLEDDYVNRTQRGNTSTYRLIPERQQSTSGTYVEAYVQFECPSIALTTTYVLP